MYNLVKLGQIAPPWADGASKKSALLGARGKAETAIKGGLPKTWRGWSLVLGRGSWMVSNTDTAAGRETRAKGQICKRSKENLDSIYSTNQLIYIYERTKVYTYIINAKLHRYLSVHMQKAGIKTCNAHNCYVRRMDKCTQRFCCS